MDLYFETAGGQIDGARDYQEDAYLTTYIDDDDGGPKSAALVIMADGMGGHAAGNIASNLVVSTFNQTFNNAFGKQDVSGLLRDALIKANNGLSESIRETPALDGMGCTMVAGAFCKGKVWWVSVGDSHLYVLRDRDLSKKNEDHSYGGYLDRMAAQGMDVEPEPGLSRNMLMSAMTGEDIAEIDCPLEPFQLLAGDRLIVASDGLDTLSTGTIIQMSAWSATPKECVEALLNAVEDAAKARQDNTTVVVVDVLAREAAPPPPRPEPTPANTHDPDATQPLDLATIEAALKAEQEAQAAVIHREADYNLDEDKSGGSLGMILGILVLLAGLGGGGYFAYTQGWLDSLLGSDTIATTPPEGPASGPSQSPTPPTTPTTPEAPTGGGNTPVVAQPTPPKTSKPPVVAPTPPPVTGIPAGTEFRDAMASGGQGPLMVVLPGGKFEMGSSALSVLTEERPQHTVALDSFSMSKFEVTVAEYRRFAKLTRRAMPSNLRASRDNHPIVFVSWDDALAYTKWLSKETGHEYRLPSEAQWEYAARGGSSSAYWWGYEFRTRFAHCFDCDTGLDPRQPTEVGRFKSNPFGLNDTAGNVLEWVYDCYHPNYNGAPTDGSVFEGGECSTRIARGGSYSSPSSSLRSAKRSRYKPTSGFDNIGFRIARLK